MSVQLKNLKEVLQIVKTLKTEIAEHLIKTGLDEELNRELGKLKNDLMKVLTTGGKTKILIERADGEFDEFRLTKSNKEMVKALADLDLEDVSKTRSYNTLVQKHVAVTSAKRLTNSQLDNLSDIKSSRMASGLDVVIPMNSSDTLESHLAQATKYFNNAVFVITDSKGNARFYKNPGIDLSQHVKIVCSNTNGNSARANQVFDRHKTGERPNGRKNSTRASRDYAMYSLKKEAFDIITNQFVDLTDIVEKMKYGEFDEALGLASKKELKKQSLEQLIDKVEKYKKGVDLDPTTQSYRNVVELIKNLKLKKSSKKDRTYYTLVTKYDETKKYSQSFEDTLNREIQLWKIDGNYKWVAALVRKKLKIIKKLMG